MIPVDMIYNAVYKGCKLEKCTELVCKDQAILACDNFKKNRFVTPQKLIAEHIKNGKQLRAKKK